VALAAASVGQAATDASPPTNRGIALLAERTAQQGAMRDSVFGEPLLLVWHDGDLHDEGEVIGELPRPFAQVAELFKSASAVCDLLFLHLNVRDCRPGAKAAAQVLDVSAGPMRETMPGLVYSISFQLRADVVAGSYLDVHLDAAAGPLGVSGVRLRLEAVPIGTDRTYIHVAYAHDASTAAQWATRLYLATAGRSKIGFTVLDRGADGKTHYIGGERAAMERNAMRHYLGVLAYTSVTSGSPPARMEARLRAWHALTERHALQLHELDLADYLQEKHDAIARNATPPN
jgi:hypothetical protein